MKIEDKHVSTLKANDIVSNLDTRLLSYVDSYNLNVTHVYCRNIVNIANDVANNTLTQIPS